MIIVSVLGVIASAVAIVYLMLALADPGRF